MKNKKEPMDMRDQGNLERINLNQKKELRMCEIDCSACRNEEETRKEREI